MYTKEPKRECTFMQPDSIGAYMYIHVAVRIIYI